MSKKISTKILKKTFFSNFEIDSKSIEKIKKLNLSYKDLNFERKIYLKDLKKKIKQNYFWKSGKNQVNKWNNGWYYNLNQLKINNKIFPSLIPFYYKKKIKLVLDGKIVQPISKLFEFKLFGIYRDFIFRKYLSNTKNIYEFGCGPLHNLVILRKIFKNKNIYGFDWSNSSIKISKQLNKKFNLKLKVSLLNFFKIKSLKKIKNDSAILTIGGFEQLGDKFKPIIDKIIASKVDLVINIESFIELYDKKNLVENIFIEYDKKRNYLNGFYKYLKKLENKKKLKILKVNKVKFGTLGHYSYSTIIWKPLK